LPPKERLGEKISAAEGENKRIMASYATPKATGILGANKIRAGGRALWRSPRERKEKKETVLVFDQ